MRFQDWDVLLFPDGSQTPFKEFKTACYTTTDTQSTGGFVAAGHNVTPLLTSFVPSLQQGTQFSISVHCWTKPVFANVTNPAPLLGEQYVWRLRATVDGFAVRTRYLPTTCTWPQVIDNSGVLPITEALLFPGFDPSTVSQREWKPADDTGRIKLEVSAGHATDLHGFMKFTKLSTVVCFSFFPAPMDHLERVGIAWPNPGMYRTLPQPRLPQPSTPMTPCGPSYQPQSLGYTPDSMQKRQLEVRLPSDQLNKVITAFKQYPGGFSSESPITTPEDSTLIMPPPPLPIHAQKRGGDHSSDVSMHAGCTHFPSCTSEDDKGHIIHSSPHALSNAVKGKKEGSSSPTKPRDFMSTILAPIASEQPPSLTSSSPMEPTGRKRTRAALRSLSINDGSPEKLMPMDVKKPVRKSSRKSSGSDKENLMVVDVD